jgi:ubiquinone biosynthesis accessory factor UbiK
MIKPTFLNDIGDKIAELVAQSPAKDIEKNIKATLTATFAKLDLVTREEFEVQQAVLADTRQQLALLEEQLARLEAQQNPVQTSIAD